MTNKKIILFAIISLSFFLSSCEDVIELDLNSSNPQIVIEANVTDTKNHFVKLSRTKNFNDDNSIIAIKGATITVEAENGATYLFSESSSEDGKYITDAFVGLEGIKYTMKVKVDDKIYTAFSTIPKKVLLDSLTITEFSFFGNTNKFVQVNYLDDGKSRNFYNYVLTVNDTVKNAYYVDEDRFNNGNKVVNTIFSDDLKLKSGDKIEVDFQCIDEKIYRYFFSISQISGNGGPPTSPANPDSNFDNGALGYFSAHTTQKVNATVK